MIEKLNIIQGSCEHYELKVNCNKEVCCFNCSDECEYKSDRCFTDSLKEGLVFSGYPKACEFYINEG